MLPVICVELKSITFFKLDLLGNSKAVLVSCKNMENDDLNLKQVYEGCPGHCKAATRFTCLHSLLNNSQNQRSSLQKELLNIGNSSVFNTIPLYYIDEEMLLSSSESAGRNSITTAASTDSFCLHFLSEKERPDKVSLCINSTSVKVWMEEASCFARDLSSWCCPGDNAVCFAHFWLSKLQYNQNLQFLELEMNGSIQNELQLWFSEELEFGLWDLYSIPVASLSEYIMELLNHQKLCYFLCYLYLVFSEQTVGYKKMLSNIKYVTNNSHIIHLAISVLTLALASLCYAVANIKKKNLKF